MDPLTLIAFYLGFRGLRKDLDELKSKKEATDHPAILMHGWAVPTSGLASNRLDSRQSSLLPRASTSAPRGKLPLHFLFASIAIRNRLP